MSIDISGLCAGFHINPDSNEDEISEWSHNAPGPRDSLS